MKTLIISDTHLSHHFEQKKFDFLKTIIASHDQVILNGDFWDSYLTTFDKFISSQWQDLFPLLKKKNGVYIYGNHDPANKSDSRISQFSVHALDTYTLQSGSNTYHVMHGHYIIPTIDMKHPVVLKIPFIVEAYTLRRRIGITLMGRWYYFTTQFENNKMKKWMHKNLPKNTKLITGHSHFAEIDKKAGYLNSGFMDFGHAQYLSINDGEESVIMARY